LNRLEQLKTIPIDAFTNEDKQLLRDEGIINGVWWSNMWKATRWLMTQLFFYLDFEVHDINYWKLQWLPEKERELGRKQADIGLLKYSWIQPTKYITNYEITGLILKDIGKLVFTIIMFILSLIPCLFLAIPAYIAVRFGGKNSFN